MSWIEKLCETYDASVKGEGKSPLLPLAHTTQIAHVEIHLSSDGNLRDICLTNKESQRTIIPCTEDSSGRTNAGAPHPLCDKLEYVAADLQNYANMYGDEAPTSGELEKFISKLNSRSKEYQRQLRSWCDDEDYSDVKLRSVLSYVGKGTIVYDMIHKKILNVDSEGKLIKGVGEDKDQDPKDAFVRWYVETEEANSDLSKDRSVWKKWEEYYTKKVIVKEMECGLDIVTGEEDVPLASNHPAKIRNDGDKAKIISSNDLNGFTYRGRFTCAKEVCTIGYETTQKAHLALRWLARKQGMHQGDWQFVAWSTIGNDVINPLSDPLGIFDEDTETTSYTEEAAAQKLNKRLIGIDQNVNTKHIVMMALDSATPGRLSIVYYKEFDGSEYCEHVKDWFESYAWYRRKHINSEEGNKNKRWIEVVCPPSIKNIVESAYGKNADDKLKKYAFNRLIPSVIEGQPVPRDIIVSVLNRASNPLAFGKGKEYEWNDVLSTACALYRGTKKGEYKMSLDKNRSTRSYLYGRLLAIANELEGRALYSAKEKRQTNAMRLMQKFSERPYSTWKIIYEALAPYRSRIDYAWYYDNVISEIMEIFDVKDFNDDRRLDGEYILAFYTQTKELRSKGDKKKEEEG